jgi:hypothetical protein
MPVLPLFYVGVITQFRLESADKLIVVALLLLNIALLFPDSQSCLHAAARIMCGLSRLSEKLHD